jgi:hypothetical protein
MTSERRGGRGRHPPALPRLPPRRRGARDPRLRAVDRRAGSCRSGCPSAWPPAAPRRPSRMTAAPDQARRPTRHWTPRHRRRGRADARCRDDAERGSEVGNHQSRGRAAKSRLVFLYHAIPDKGFFHLPCISLKALLCVSSPLATISFRWLSCASITSFAVLPWKGKSHGPPNCLHVIVFMSLASFHTRLSGFQAAASAGGDWGCVSFGVVVVGGACARNSWRISSRRSAVSMSV